MHYTTLHYTTLRTYLLANHWDPAHPMRARARGLTAMRDVRGLCMLLELERGGLAPRYPGGAPARGTSV